MLDPVDLDHHAPLLPHHVEVVATVSTAPYDLAGGLGEAPPTALAGEVELGEAVHTAEQVRQEVGQERQAAVPLHLEERLPDPIGRRDALLDRHRHQQGGLAVAPRPQGTADGGDLRARARRPGATSQVVDPPSTRLAYVDECVPEHPGPTGDRDPVAVDVEAGESRRDQRRRTVEAGTRTARQLGRPQHRREGHRPGVHDDDVTPHPLPTPSADVGPHLGPAEPCGVELATGHSPPLVAPEAFGPPASGGPQRSGAGSRCGHRPTVAARFVVRHEKAVRLWRTGTRPPLWTVAGPLSPLSPRPASYEGALIGVGSYDAEGGHPGGPPHHEALGIWGHPGGRYPRIAYQDIPGYPALTKRGPGTDQPKRPEM